MSAQRTIKSYVLHKYGLHISAENPEFDKEARKWVANIKSDYPIYLQDDRCPEDVLLHFIPIKQIGQVSFDENLGLLSGESTPREKCLENIQCLLKTYYDRTERIVVQASADCLVQIPEFRHFFTPIDQILSAFLENESVPIDDLLRHRSAKSQAKIKQYLQLLEAMNIIHQNGEIAETCETYWLLHQKYEDEKFQEEGFRKAIISELLRKNYTALRQVFEISRFQPSIHIDSCIYRPAIEAEEQICLSTESIMQYYRTTYGRINDSVLVNYLRRLHVAGAIEREGKYWCGTENLLSDMMTLKNDMPELAPPLMH